MALKTYDNDRVDYDRLRDAVDVEVQAVAPGAVAALIDVRGVLQAFDPATGDTGSVIDYKAGDAPGDIHGTKMADTAAVQIGKEVLEASSDHDISEMVGFAKGLRDAGPVAADHSDEYRRVAVLVDVGE